MLQTFRKAFQIEDIRRKILYTLAMLFVVRLGSQLPTPGVDPTYIQNFFANQTGDSFNFFNAFTGGSFETMSIFALSITPYITSSIIIQLLTIAIPKLEEMQKEGEDGRKKLTALTRYVTVVLALIESTAMAQFAAGGKETKKKDLASIAMSYGYVYVAQIAMGADFNQTVKAIAEAEAYPGPSLIIAYAPCINHGIKKGMSKAQTEEQLAVECGYWNNFRFNPAAEGSKFTLDSKAPDLAGYEDFLNGEVRYNALARFNPEKAKVLFAKNEEEAKARYAYLQKLVTLYGSEE